MKNASSKNNELLESYLTIVPNYLNQPFMEWKGEGDAFKIFSLLKVGGTKTTNHTEYLQDQNENELNAKLEGSTR